MELGAGRDRDLKKPKTSFWPLRQLRRRIFWGAAAAGALLWVTNVQAQEGTTVPADVPSSSQPDRIIRSTNRVIIRQSPVIIRHPSVIILPYPRPYPEDEQVRVEFDARGSDWGAVYLNNRLVYRPGNFDRQETLYLPPGGYRLEITGVVRSDRWASGYLDLGRDDSQIVVVRFSKTGGVNVSGSPYVWIPD